MGEIKPSKHTLCWDCAKAVGGCSWSDHDRHTPVDGWTAEERYLRIDCKGGCMTYVVRECPEFVRDGTGGGVNRYPAPETDKNVKNRDENGLF